MEGEGWAGRGAGWGKGARSTWIDNQTSSTSPSVTLPWILAISCIREESSKQHQRCCLLYSRPNHLISTCSSVIFSLHRPFPHAVQPFPPSITQHPADVITPDGGAANFTCSANGSPPPSFTWTLGGNTIAPSAGAAITSNGDSSTLSLTSVRNTSAGVYQCTATNSQGTASSNTAQLQIASKCC